MPYILPENRLAVFFSPKAAGTSIRAFMFEVENGFPLRSYRFQGVAVNLDTMANRLLENVRFDRVDHNAIADYDWVALVRDPVRRVLSAYTNRVVYYRELSNEIAGAALKAAGLPPDPDFDLFMANIKAYTRCSKSIARHFCQQDDFLGKKKLYYDAIFRVEEMDEFENYVNQRFGTNCKVPRLQEGGPKLDFWSLSAETRRRVIDFVRPSVIFDWFPQYRESYAEFQMTA
ncbi:MAG: sulfotransferase family 2 domain-containing protein [Tabrizicola sp.]|nr:sulfotransferase family 2 domain-containing protein [Tabrizicola sp.]